MSDPVPRKTGVGRWIFLGCAGCGGLALLGVAGCAGLLFYLHRTSDPIAKVGATYLRSSPEVSEYLGTPLTIERKRLGWKVRLHHDAGTAFIAYTLAGPKGRKDAGVWLRKDAGVWSAQGAHVEGTGGGPLLEIGKPPNRHLPELDWDE